VNTENGRIGVAVNMEDGKMGVKNAVPVDVNTENRNINVRIVVPVSVNTEGVRVDVESVGPVSVNMENGNTNVRTVVKVSVNMENLNISEDELKSAYEEILKLNPKPSTGMDAGSRQSIQYIEPDFFIFNRDGELELSLNSRNSPDLRINETYRDMIRNLRARNKSKSLNKQEKETAIFIKEKIESANNFIDSIKRRQNTLYDTMNTIMHIQYDYFLTGDTRLLRPMILKDVAERIGVDISTVSRVANSKYVQTEFGTKSLKEFFNESIQTSDGDEVTTEELNKTLIELINNENKSNPLSDDKLVGVLKKSGYNLSRRTVAKYRERLNIPVARLRKEM